MTIKNKTAWITGGSKGIGYGIAEQLLRENYKVCITGRSEKTITEAVNRLKAEMGQEIPLMGSVADVRNIDSLQEVAAGIAKYFGSLDVLVANAGVGHFASIEELTPEQWHETIDTNLTGVFNTVKAGLELLKKSQGYIITISSLAGTNFFEKGTAYNASKFGLTGFTQALMLDVRKYGIKTTTIMPGSVATHFNDHHPGAEDYWKIQPEDIGIMVAGLLKLPPRTLPSKIEVRPTNPPKGS